eukprot:Gb_19785 [translate_table: standard]
MPQGLEYHCKERDLKKRKDSVLDSQSNSSSNEWESSSSTVPLLKRRKSQSDWRCSGTEEVGDNDDLHFMGREIFEPAKGIGLGKIKMDQIGLQGQKDDVVEIHGSDAVMHVETTKMEGNQVTEMMDDHKMGHEPLTLNGTRSCMLSIITELKQAREKMLMWMRQEMQKIMYEGSGSPGVRISFGEHDGGDMEFEEQQVSGHNGNSMGIADLGNGGGEMDFGAEATGSDGTGFAAQNSLVDGVGYNAQNCSRDLNFATQNCSRAREDIGFGKENGRSDGVGMGFGAQKSGGHVDVGMGVRGNSDGRMNFGNQSRASGGGVPMAVQNGSVEVVHLGTQSGRDGVLGFRTLNEVPGDITFGAQQTGVGVGLNYVSQAGGGPRMVFGRQSVDSGTQDRAGGRGRVEIRSSTGMGSTNTPTNSARNRQVNAVQISNEERTPDLIGMQNPVALNMMWNNVVQNPRDVNQNISTSGVHGFNFDTHNKLGNGGIGQYRGLVCNSTPYENSTGMVNSPVIQTVNPTLGMQLPMGLQNASSNTLNSSSMPPLMGMQNQVAVHNLSGMQNFLGLSMNGNVGLQTVGEGTNRHVFPGLYLNGHAHVLNAKSNHIPGSSGIDGRSNKRGDTVHGMDILELNT